MSDTPRTDAFIKSDDVRLDASCMRSAVDWSTIPMKRESLLIDFARQLEHELTAAKVEIERLTREQDDMCHVLERSGFRRCDIAACNCGSWHHVYGLRQRWEEVKDALAEAGHPLTNGHIVLRALMGLIKDRDDAYAKGFAD